MIRPVLCSVILAVVAVSSPASGQEKQPPRTVERDGKKCLQYHDVSGRLIERCPGEEPKILADPTEMRMLESLPDADKVYGRGASYQLAFTLDGTAATSHYISTTLTTGLVRGMLSADYFFAHGLALGLEGGGDLVLEHIAADGYDGARTWSALAGGPRLVWLPLGPVATGNASSLGEALGDGAFSVVGRVRWLSGSDPDGAVSVSSRASRWRFTCPVFRPRSASAFPMP